MTKKEPSLLSLARAVENEISNAYEELASKEPRVADACWSMGRAQACLERLIEKIEELIVDG